MPADFTIEYHYSGGMLNEYKTIFLSGTRCRLEGRINNKDFRYVWRNTDREAFNTLYTSLRKLGAFTIPYRTEKEVYDRGGESIRYIIDGKDYVVSNAGLDFVKKKYGDAFNESTRMIIHFADDQVADGQVPDTYMPPRE